MNKVKNKKKEVLSIYRTTIFLQHLGNLLRNTGQNEGRYDEFTFRLIKDIL